MPIVADSQRNFLSGLGAFWTKFFKDTAQLQTWFDATQILLGQAYLDLLQATLGTNLKNMPLFSKKYFKLLTLRDGTLSYVEGAAPEDDRWAFSSPDVLAAVPSLMNVVIGPTSVLENGVDYDVENGEILFHVDPFNTDGAGTSQPLFPVRTVQVAYPAQFTDLAGRSWPGVREGDTFSFTVLGSPAYQTTVIGFDGAALLLSVALPEFTTIAGKSINVDVLRTPWNSQVTGQLIAQVPEGIVDVTDAVPQAGTKVVNTASAVFAWIGQYLYLYDRGGDPTNNGFYQITSQVTGVSVTVNRAYNFVAPSDPSRGTEAHVVNFGMMLTSMPVAFLGNTFVTPGSVAISARRLYDRIVAGVTYPAGEQVIEGVDYLLDEEAGNITYLSVWDPLLPPRASYAWSLNILSRSYPYELYNAGHTYAVGAVVGVTISSVLNFFVCVTAGVGGYPGNFVEFVEPFATQQVHSVREIAMWAPDVLVDVDALYNNFGYLLSFQRPTSESYRAFLRGVSQLFLIGPTLERFESALNAMAGYPVVRDDGEVLLNYASGILASGSDGELIGSGSNRDGTFTHSGSLFDSPTANFFPSDLGAVLEARVGPSFTSYAITTVNSPTEVVVSPQPADEVGVQWEYSHNTLTNRFRVTAGSYQFSQEDVGGSIIVNSTENAKNVGAFTIVAVESASQVVLSSVYGFTDESGLSWQLSRTKTQVVTTSRTTYQIPLLVPPQPFLLNSSNYGVLVLDAFDTLTTAFTVTDYVSDPTWWHNISIPKELLQLTVEDGGRRRVTPQLIPHVFGALDHAVFGDFGLIYGCDDEGRPGEARQGTATWYGGTSVVFDVNPQEGVDGQFILSGSKFSSSTVTFTPADVGLVIHTQLGTVVQDYEVTSYVNAQTVVVQPSIGANASFVKWSFTYGYSQQGTDGVLAASGNHFSSATAAFSLHDVDRLLHVILGGVGQDYVIETVIDVHNVTLTATPPNASGVTWSFSHLPSLGPQPNDTSQYLVTKDPTWKGFFPVTAVDYDGRTLSLGRFPPPASIGLVPPQTFAAQLPPLIYRRTVAFILMDRFLKYHAIQVSIDKNTPLSQELVAEMTSLLSQAKPSEKYIYLEPVTDFVDTMEISDALLVTFGPLFLDHLFAIDNQMNWSGDTLLAFNDWFSYASQSNSMPSTAPSATYTLVPTSVPTSPSPRLTTFLFGRFDPAVLVNSGARRPAEGVDYTFNYSTGEITILSTANFTGAAATFHYVVLFLRTSPGSPIALETPIVYNGADPARHVSPTQTENDTGLLDRALQVYGH